jgi:hypothetical protein
MSPKTPGPDPGTHVREEVRRIIADEDRDPLGVKARAPIPASEQERIALAMLRHLNGACLEPRSSKSPATPESTE